MASRDLYLQVARERHERQRVIGRVRPQQHDGASARLAGTMLWFCAVELIQRDGADKTRSIVPVAECQTLPDAAHPVFANLTSPRAPLQMGARTIRLDQPQVMGILNLTPDSFSDGGKLGDDPDAATAAGVALSASGAAILDIGGESTRPGAPVVWEGDEIKRILNHFRFRKHCLPSPNTFHFL